MLNSCNFSSDALLGLFHQGFFYSRSFFRKDKPKTEDLDVTLCSHLILIGSCTLNDECRIMLPPVELISEINKLKERNDRLKVLFSLTPNNRCMSKVVSETIESFSFYSQIALQQNKRCYGKTMATKSLITGTKKF